ncbi:putative mediator of RNA polymerase II transcription subunit 31 [Apostichopus japonicus]|uniref:Mediator of RNA polymerase II transcription subunit 31 n=1 Tax=Stichopus japonicus TaxID=307972 RepID=A0A2G8JB97_STIJA|nr:putative mediator of RNA polymerase II transcription subunit 31 [Apostichopus japonicus]
MNAGLVTEQQDPEKLRFQVELEFVQCLANPHYLNFLAQRDYFKDSRFVNYLKYLQYWKDPHYAKFLKYPQCLHFLELLQYESFRKELANAQCVRFIEDQQLLHWQHYSYKRMRLQQSHLDNLHQQHAQQQQQQQQQQSTHQQTTQQQSGMLPPPQQQPASSQATGLPFAGLQPQHHQPGQPLQSQTRLLQMDQKPLQSLPQNSLNTK